MDSWRVLDGDKYAVDIEFTIDGVPYVRRISYANLDVSTTLKASQSISAIGTTLRTTLAAEKLRPAAVQDAITNNTTVNF